MAKWETKLEGEVVYLITEVGFKKKLSSSDTVKVLETILSVIKQEFRVNLFEGFASLCISESALKIIFTFSPYPQPMKLEESADRENLSRQKVQFIFYLFAKINEIYRLEDVPFTSDFNHFLSFPDYYGASR